MVTKDPAVSMRKMREQAIELCQKRVVADESEDLVGGWTVLSPHMSGSLTAQPFEEVVLLLTDAALYLCRFDWNLDKVSSFERVELGHVEKIRFGAYIVSTISATQMDEVKNVGLTVTYRPGCNDVMRLNTRSLSSLPSRPRRDPKGGRSPPTGLASLLGGRANAPAARTIALKALYSQSSLAEPEGGPRPTEIQQVVAICAEIERLVLHAKPAFPGTKPETIIEKGDVISLAEARRSTGLLEHLGHSIKRMVWA